MRSGSGATEAVPWWRSRTNDSSPVLNGQSWKGEPALSRGFCVQLNGPPLSRTVRVHAPVQQKLVRHIQTRRRPLDLDWWFKSGNLRLVVNTSRKVCHSHQSWIWLFHSTAICLGTCPRDLGTCPRDCLGSLAHSRGGGRLLV